MHYYSRWSELSIFMWRYTDLEQEKQRNDMEKDEKESCLSSDLNEQHLIPSSVCRTVGVGRANEGRASLCQLRTE